MKYLFFDIECSNCFKGEGKLCEFGYVLTDTNFNILKKDVIPMCPGKDREDRFDFGIYKRDPDFDWAYDKDTYMECPEFPYYYKKIKKLFNEDNIMIFGYAVENDIRYVLGTCERYDLDPYSFITYDTQRLAKDYIPKDHKMHLNNVFTYFYGEEALKNVEPHLSRDDAYMTMMVLKAIIKESKLSVEELYDLHKECVFNSIEYFNKYKEDKIKREELKLAKLECNKIYDELINSYKDIDEETLIHKKKVTLNGSIRSDVNLTIKACNKIKELDLLPVYGINNSDYFICLNEEEILGFKEHFKEPYNGIMVPYEEFINGDFNINKE